MNKSHDNHVLYDNKNEKIYYACHKSCKVCKEWSKPSNIWKFFTFFPYHCAACQYAGYPNDFFLIDNCVFVCKNCKSKYVNQFKKLKNHIR